MAYYNVIASRETFVSYETRLKVLFKPNQNTEVCQRSVHQFLVNNYVDKDINNILTALCA